jgi:phospholipid transport system substrate-binding protein
VTASLLLALLALGPAPTPRATVQDATDRVMAIVRGDASLPEDAGEGLLRPRPGDRRAEIRRIAEALFDAEEVSRRALGRHWAARTPAERTEFVRVFTDVLARAYLGRLEGYAGARITILAESVDGAFAVVRSRVMSPRDGETTLDYQMRQADGRWKVYDVLVDGVSFVASYRSQFDRFIMRSSYAALIDQLRRNEAAAPTALRAPPPARR